MKMSSDDLNLLPIFCLNDSQMKSEVLLFFFDHPVDILAQWVVFFHPKV